MTLVIIFGPPAAGKMTVGQELSRLTGLRLFHNHQAIELVINYFAYGTPKFIELVDEFRGRIFREVAHSDLAGMIFTYAWALNVESDKQFIDRTTDLFRRRGAEVYFVELQCDLSTRLVRNKTENRLREKPTKRNLEFSESNLLQMDEKYVMNSSDDFIYSGPQYLKIDNTHCSALQAATLIAEYFKL